LSFRRLSSLLTHLRHDEHIPTAFLTPLPSLSPSLPPALNDILYGSSKAGGERLSFRRLSSLLAYAMNVQQGVGGGEGGREGGAAGASASLFVDFDSAPASTALRLNDTLSFLLADNASPLRGLLVSGMVLLLPLPPSLPPSLPFSSLLHMCSSLFETPISPHPPSLPPSLPQKSPTQATSSSVNNSGAPSPSFSSAARKKHAIAGEGTAGRPVAGVAKFEGEATSMHAKDDEDLDLNSFGTAVSV